MVQTENGDEHLVEDDNNVEMRTLNECLAIYKSQVK